MRPLRARILVLVIALLAAACGSAGTTTTDGGAATTAADGGATTTAADGGATTTEAEAGATTTTEADAETTTTAAAERETLIVAIGNLRAIQYFPIYVADAGGYFDDEGLDVEIEIVSGSGAVVQQLIAGNVDVMLASPAAAINAVAGGQDLATFCSTHYQSIFTLAVPTESGITDVAGLDGATIGISEPSGGEVPVVRAALATADLVEEENYTLLAIGEGGQLTFEALSNGDADAYSSSVFDVAAVEAAGLALTHVLPDEFLYVPSIGLTVTRETLENRSDALARFGRAYAKANTWGSQPENREAVNELIRPYNEELFEDPAFVDAVWEATIRLTTPPPDLEGEPYCSHYIPGWETYVAAASEAPEEEGGLAGPVDIAAMADMSLLDQINDFDPSSVDPPTGG